MKPHNMKPESYCGLLLCPVTLRLLARIRCMVCARAMLLPIYLNKQPAPIDPYVEWAVTGHHVGFPYN